MLTRPAPIVRGMLWMAATGLLFIVLNTIMKRLSHELDPWLVGFLRYLFGAAVMLGPALRLGAGTLWPKAPGLQFTRGLFHAGGMMLWFAALPMVTLAELTAIGFSGPLFICLGAALFLGAGGHYCMTRAFRVADISAIQPVKFLELVWAAILGILVFGTAPAGATVIGGVVILASTLLLAHHESRAAPVKESAREAA